MHVCGWRRDGAGKDKEKNSGQNEHECVGGWGRDAASSSWSGMEKHIVTLPQFKMGRHW